MQSISQIESRRQIRLPEVYSKFYDQCADSIPPALVGTDLFNYYPQLNEWAAELLQEEGIENFLDRDDFVFMMHQGYMFWYFKADGDPDPVVYGYYENKLKPDNFGSLSNFIKEYI